MNRVCRIATSQNDSVERFKAPRSVRKRKSRGSISSVSASLRVRADFAILVVNRVIKLFFYSGRGKGLVLFRTVLQYYFFRSPVH